MFPSNSLTKWPYRSVGKKWSSNTLTMFQGSLNCSSPELFYWSDFSYFIVFHSLSRQAYTGTAWVYIVSLYNNRNNWETFSVIDCDLPRGWVLSSSDELVQVILYTEAVIKRWCNSSTTRDLQYWYKMLIFLISLKLANYLAILHLCFK